MRVLVANPFGIGDVLFSHPLVRALRRSGSVRFTGYLCNRRTFELVSNWPEVDWTLMFEKDEFRAAARRSKREGALFLARMVRSVRQKKFDLLLDLSLGWQIGLAALLAGIPKRVGFDFRGRGRFLTDRIPLQGFHIRPVPDYYLDLLAPLGIPRPFQPESPLISVPASMQTRAEEYLQAWQISRGKKLIGIVPGGGTSWGPNAVFKQWPPDRFARVADAIAARHNAEVLILGDNQESVLCRRVADSMTSTPKMATQIHSLLILAGLLKRCDLVIGNDGGAMHLAAAVGTKTVSIFGPVDGSVYGPPPDLAKHRIVSKGLACRPCYQGFRFPPCPWDNACLKQLDTEPVLEAAHALLS